MSGVALVAVRASATGSSAGSGPAGSVGSGSPEPTTAPPVPQPVSPPGTAQGMPLRGSGAPLRVDALTAQSVSSNGEFFVQRANESTGANYEHLVGVSQGAIGLAADGSNGYINILGQYNSLYAATAGDTFSGFGPAPGSAVGGVSAALISAVNPTVVRYAVMASDHKLYARNSNDQSYYSLGGELTATPAVVHASSNDTVYYIARGTDNALYVRTDHTNFTSLGGNCTSGPGAAAHGSRIVIACEAGNQNLYEATLTVPADQSNPAAATFHDLGGTIHASPGVYYAGTATAPTYVVKGDPDSAGNNIYRRTPNGVFTNINRSCQGPPASADDGTYYYFMCTSTVSPTPPPPSTVSLWGVDTYATINSQYSNATGSPSFGNPDFWGQYLGNLVSSQVQFAHDHGVQLLLLGQGPHTTINENSCQNGIDDATSEVAKAAALGVPHGTAIFQDVEPNGSNITTSFIECYYNTMHSDGRYEPGFYASPNVGDFSARYCAAAQSDSKSVIHK